MVLTKMKQSALYVYDKAVLFDPYVIVENIFLSARQNKSLTTHRGKLFFNCLPVINFKYQEIIFNKTLII